MQKNKESSNWTSYKLYTFLFSDITSMECQEVRKYFVQIPDQWAQWSHIVQRRNSTAKGKFFAPSFCWYFLPMPRKASWKLILLLIIRNFSVLPRQKRNMALFNLVVDRSFIYNINFINFWQSDLFAIEIYGGHLQVHIDLGAGPTKQRGSRKKVDDGAWHEVTFRRTGREARITVDGYHTDFKTPGKQLSLF